jgi:hypothetical protein
LLALFVNDADLAGADSLIDADKLFRGTLIDGYFSSGAAKTARHLVYQRLLNLDAKGKRRTAGIIRLRRRTRLRC